MKINRRGRYYFGVIIVYVLIACFTLTSCSILFGSSEQRINEELEEPDGKDWRTWRSYGDQYVLSNEMTVSFSSLDSRNGYAAYDMSYGGRIGTLMLPEPLIFDDIGDCVFEIEDYNGDGLTDVGIKTNDGTVIRYLFVPDNIGTWPDMSAAVLPALMRI